MKAETRGVCEKLWARGRTGLSAGATIQALNECKLVLPEGNSTPVYILIKKHNFARFDDSLTSLWGQVTLRRTEFRETSHTVHYDHERDPEDGKLARRAFSRQSYPHSNDDRDDGATCASPMARRSRFNGCWDLAAAEDQLVPGTSEKPS